MKDYIIRAIASSEHIRAFASVTSSLVEEARNIHNTTPVATAALGRLLTAGAMMGIMSKGEKDIITLQIKGNGELGGVLAISDSKANVRGYVYNPGADLPLRADGKLDVGGAIGKGYLNVIKDIGLGEPYTGQIALVSGEIAEDIAYYYATSEQINSVVGLGVVIERDYSVNIAGGFIIQAMPGITEEELSKLEENLKDMTSVTEAFKKYKTPEKVLNHILKGFEFSIIDKVPAKYVCDCSKDRVERALISLGKKELESLINEQGTAELTCHFCNKKYNFNKEQLQELYNHSTRA